MLAAIICNFKWLLLFIQQVFCSCCRAFVYTGDVSFLQLSPKTKQDQSTVTRLTSSLIHLWQSLIIRRKENNLTHTSNIKSFYWSDLLSDKGQGCASLRNCPWCSAVFRVGYRQYEQSRAAGETNSISPYPRHALSVPNMSSTSLLHVMNNRSPHSTPLSPVHSNISSPAWEMESLVKAQSKLLESECNQTTTISPEIREQLCFGWKVLCKSLSHFWEGLLPVWHFHFFCGPPVQLVLIYPHDVLYHHVVPVCWALLLECLLPRWPRKRASPWCPWRPPCGLRALLFGYR